jgi:hypothetical protein
MDGAALVFGGVFTLLAIGCLGLGFYRLYLGVWVEASAFFLASIASFQIGRPLLAYIIERDTA